MARIVKKFADRKAEIIQAAKHLFREKEYEKTSMQEIIDFLKIAKGTLYHYFKSKDMLLEAVIEDIVSENIEKLELLVQSTKGNALEKMKRMVKAGHMATDNQNLLDQLHKPGNNAMHTRLLAAALMKQAPLYAKIIKQGCKEGIFKTESPLECAEFILSAMQFLTDVGIYPWAQEDLSRRIKAFPKLIEKQLGASSGSFQFLIQQMTSQQK